MHKRCKECRYRATGWGDGGTQNGCDYISHTQGQSRLKAVLDMLGTTLVTAEALRLLKPKNCPFFEPGDRGLLPGRRPPMGRPPKFDAGKALALYREGKNDREIAAALGVKRHNIYNWRKNRNLPANYERRQSGAKAEDTPHQITRMVSEAAAVREGWEKGLTDWQIAEETGLRRSKVYRLRHELGLKSKHSPARIDGERILALLEEGMNDREIAATLGKKARDIQRWRHRNGVKSQRERQAEGGKT